MGLRGETIGTAFVRILAQGKDLGRSIRDQFKDAEPDIEQAGRETSESFRDGFDDDFSDHFNDDLDRSMRNPDVRDSARESGHSLGGAFGDGFNDGFSESSSDREFDMFGSLDDLDEFTNATDDMGESVRRTSKDIDDLGDDMDDFGRRTRRASDDGDRFSDTLAKMFGKGSRNDFLNIVGRIIGGIASLSESVSDLVIKFIGGGEGLDKLTQSLIGGGIGILTFTAVLGPLIAGISLLAGAVTALAASLSFAALSVIPIIIGGFAALAVSAGVVFLAIKGIEGSAESMAHLGHAAQPLVNTFNDLATSVGDRLVPAIAGILRATQGVLVGLGPLVEHVAGVFAHLTHEVSDFLRRGYFAIFIESLENALPGIIRDFGQATINIFRGIMGLIQASLPFVAKFANGLEDITRRFAFWSTTLVGQNWLNDFFSQAVDSAKSVWHFASALFEVVGDLLSAGRESGNTLFDEMADALQRVSAYLQANPEALAKFFEDSVTFAESLGHIIESIIDLFVELNTEANRLAITEVFDTIALSIEGVARLLGQVTQVAGPLAAALAGVAKGFAFIASAISKPLIQAGLLYGVFRIGLGLFTAFKVGLLGISSGAAAASGGLARFGAVAGAAVAKMASMRGGVALAGIALLQFQPKIAGVDVALGALTTAAGYAAIGFSVGGAWGAAIGGAVGLLIGLKSVIVGTTRTTEEERAAVDSLTTSLNRATGAYTENTRAKIAQGFIDSGAIEDARTMGLTLNDLVNLSLHPAKNAYEDLSAAIKAGSGNNAPAADADQMFVDLGQAIDAARGDAQDARVQFVALLEVLDPKRFAAMVDIADNTRHMGTAVDEFGNSLEGLPTAMEGVEQKSQDMRTDLQKQVDILNKATTGLEDYKAALDNLIDTDGNVFDAQRALSQSFRDAAKEVKGHSKSLDDNTTAGNKNIDLIEGMVDKVKDLVIEYKDADKGPKFLDRALANNRQELIKSAVQMGFQRDDVVSLLATYGLTPKFIATLFAANGTDKAATDADHVKKHVEDVPTDWVTQMGQLGAQGVIDDADRVKEAIERIPLTWTTHIGISGETSLFDRFGMGAAGGVFFGATPMIIGEAGREALVPLDRPLSQVDPAVRWLAAVAQGKAASSLVGSGSTKTIDVGGITIVTPTENPAAVAQEAINRLAAASYF